MKFIYKSSELYAGCDSTIYYVENRGNSKERKFMRRNLVSYVKRLNKTSSYRFKCRTIGNTLFGSRSLKNLILRNNPTLSKEQLEEKVRSIRKGEEQEGKRARLFCVTQVYNLENLLPSLEIIACDTLGKENIQDAVAAFFDNIAQVYKKRDKECIDGAVQATDAPYSNIRYKLPEDKAPYARTTPEERKENRELFATEILAGSISDKAEVEISPIVIDEKYNIILPLYPQIKIKMEPLPKSIYLLFLHHPEGIVLKNISDYEEEIKKIYLAISGRKNISVTNRLIEKMCDPTENMLHKTLSIIRKTFCNKMNIDIAQTYIPTTGRSTAHRVPIRRNMVHLSSV